MSWRVKFRLFQIATYGIVFADIALFAVLTGKYIETIGLFVSFVSIRYAFDKTYHSKSFWWCIFISCVIFAIAITFVPNKGVSLLSCVTFGLIIDYLAYKYKDYDDLFRHYNKPFSVDTCSQAELILRCEELHLSEENKKLAIEFFIKKTKCAIIADELCIEEGSVHKRKQRMRKKLNKI